jgi:Bacteriophage related domain of unknown function
MASLTAYDAFVTRLASWTICPVVYENQFFETSNEPAPFVYVEIFGDTYDQETLGAPRANQWLESGITYLHVMTPSGRGSRTARDYANQLLYLFREQPIATLFMPEMSIGAGDPGRDFPAYFAMTATIFWYRRDITAIT